MHAPPSYILVTSVPGASSSLAWKALDMAQDGGSPLLIFEKDWISKHAK